MLFQIKNASVEIGSNLILKRVNFEIRDNEKIAIVGRNGSGKTTLLKLISGEIEMTKIEGEDSFIAKSNKLSIGYLKQNPFQDLEITVDDEMKKLFDQIRDDLKTHKLIFCEVNGNTGVIVYKMKDSDKGKMEITVDIWEKVRGKWLCKKSVSKFE